MRDRRIAVLVLAAILAASGTTVRAATITSTASDNSTINPSGPRTGPNNQNFFNMENSTSGGFAGFGVVDFPVAANPSVIAVNSLTLSLTQDNAGFTSNGNLRFFLTEDTTTNIDNNGAPPSPLTFNSGSPPNGIDGQLTPNFLLGTGAFTQGTMPATNGGATGSGKVDTFTFSLSSLPGSAQSYLVGRIDSGGVIRLIIAPDDSTVAATYAWFQNSSYAGPQLAIVATTPEPASVITMGLGLSGLACFLAWKRTAAVGWTPAEDGRRKGFRNA